MVSCPVMTSRWTSIRIGSAILRTRFRYNLAHAIDAQFAMAQHISALSYGDMALKIWIRGVDTEEQALVFLYMASSQLSPEKYMEILNDFIVRYP